jgi:antitoxin (DNA-binding transcriptional repressor) of toxin-antitoxin stability system
MKTVSVRSLRNTPGALWRSLKAAGTVALTANGVPKALVIGIEGEDLEAALAAVNRARAQLALTRLRAAAQAAGTDRLSAEEIAVEVRAVRRAR